MASTYSLLKKPFVIFALGLLSVAAWADMATWTGNSVQAESITGRYGWNCEYDLYGKKFWKFTTQGYCPVSIEVQ
jgi:hypothetical protein